jgi:hypothetical protein
MDRRQWRMPSTATAAKYRLDRSEPLYVLRTQDRRTRTVVTVNTGRFAVHLYICPD